MPPKRHTRPFSSFTLAAAECFGKAVATNQTRLDRFSRGDHRRSSAHPVSHRLRRRFDNLALEILDNGVALPLNDDTISMTVQKLGDRVSVFKGVLPIAPSEEKRTAIRRLVKRPPLTAYPTLA